MFSFLAIICLVHVEAKSIVFLLQNSYLILINLHINLVDRLDDVFLHLKGYGSFKPQCHFWKLQSGKVYKNCFYGTQATRTSTSTSTKTSTSTSTSTPSSGPSCLAYQNHYWNLNNNLLDSAGGSLTSTTTYTWTTDRLGRSNSALYLNNAYINFPTNVYYFTGINLSITFWMNTISISTNWQRIFDMSTTLGKFYDSIYMSWNGGTNPAFIFTTLDSAGGQNTYVQINNVKSRHIQTHTNTNKSFRYYSRTSTGVWLSRHVKMPTVVYFYNNNNKSLPQFALNSWIFYCVTIDSVGSGNVYWNNTLMGSATGMKTVRNVIRNIATLGTDSSYSVSAYANAVYDDLRFFTTILSSSDRTSLMSYYV